MSIEFSPREYYDDLNSFVYDEAMNGGSGVKIVYSAMHGVGADFLDRAFKVAGLGPVVHVKKQRGTFQTLQFEPKIFPSYILIQL